MDLVCYETIDIFVEKDDTFNHILDNHYQRKTKDLTDKDDRAKTGRLWFCTHHSPNRLLSNYRSLDRKVMDIR